MQNQSNTSRGFCILYHEDLYACLIFDRFYRFIFSARVLSCQSVAINFSIFTSISTALCTKKSQSAGKHDTVLNAETVRSAHTNI